MMDVERESYLEGGEMGKEYLREIGKTDLAIMSHDEALTFLECVCKGYHAAYIRNNAAVRDYMDKDSGAISIKSTI